jgi:hypothetical protein
MAEPPRSGDAQVSIPVSGADDSQSPVTIPVSDDDNDSSYSADAQSLTTSLASSIWEYHYENGRRYNSFRKGTYWYGYPRPQVGTDLAIPH